MAGVGERTTLTRSPSGAQISEEVGPKRATVGAPTAAARWDTPETLPMKSLAAASVRASEGSEG